MSIIIEDDDSVGKCLNMLEIILDSYNLNDELLEAKTILAQAFKDHINNIKEWDKINIRYKE